MRNAIMLPSKLLVNLVKNNRISQLDMASFAFTAILFTNDLNDLVFFVTEESKWPTNIYKVVGRIMLAQVGSLIMLLTLVGFFKHYKVPLSANYVQQNYEDYGIWGETYTREDLKGMQIAVYALLFVLILIIAIQGARIYKVIRPQLKSESMVESRTNLIERHNDELGSEVDDVSVGDGD